MAVQHEPDGRLHRYVFYKPLAVFARADLIVFGSKQPTAWTPAMNMSLRHLTLATVELP